MLTETQMQFALIEQSVLKSRVLAGSLLQNLNSLFEFALSFQANRHEYVHVLIEVGIQHEAGPEVKQGLLEASFVQEARSDIIRDLAVLGVLFGQLLEGQQRALRVLGFKQLFRLSTSTVTYLPNFGLHEAGICGVIERVAGGEPALGDVVVEDAANGVAGCQVG